MDRVEWGVKAFRQANRHALNVPFSHLMRKLQVDPVEAAPRLRNLRQEPKK
jgi:hypothetical protein